MKTTVIVAIIFQSIVFNQTIDQIKQAKSIIKSTGMSETQARNTAKAQGLTDKQINAAIEKEINKKDKKREPENETIELINPINSDVTNNVNEKQPELENLDSDKNGDLPIMEEDDLEIIDESKIDLQSKAQTNQQSSNYFGYDIFARDPSLFQATSVGIVDPDYLIGPGDEIIVMLWGETQFRQVLTVDREGFVFIPEIGQVFVNGLNLKLLESKLFRVFSQSYASLNPQGRTPTTFLDISLGNLRPLRIQVLGEVAQPGAYTVSPSATLFSALYYFNGPLTSGSLREIHLIRGGKKIKSIDFYDYLLTGKKPEDQKLQLDDVIFIPRRLKTVSISGEINRGGIYELKQDENLADLIAMAGDLKVSAYLNRAQVDRIVAFKDREKLGMDRMFIDVNIEEILKSDKGFLLQDGDKVQIFSVLDLRQNVVALSGAVTRPGSYDLGDSLKISELIKKADGLLGDAYLERIDVIRTKPDFNELLIKLDLGKAINGDPSNDIFLQGMDRVKVYGMSEMVQKPFVSINGHVKQPGKFLLQDNMTIYDLIFKAGGYLDDNFKKASYLDRAELVRENKSSGDKEIIPFNLGEVLDGKGMASEPLKDSDALRLYSSKEIEGNKRYVGITGHVKSPGRYELFKENMTIYDLIFKAGGFEDNRHKAQTFLSRADLIRFSENQINKTIIPFNLEAVLKNPNDKQNFKLVGGDEIRIYPLSYFNVIRPITIDGAVRSPGEYELKTNMTMKDLILEAGGLSENVYRYKIEVARIDPLETDENILTEIIMLDMDNDYFIVQQSSSYKGSEESINGNFFLMPYDYVSIRPDQFFKMQEKVKVSGEVYYPGSYAITNSEETIADIIDRSGGLKSNSFALGSRFSRNGQNVQLDLRKIVKRPKSRANIIVQGGDEIFVASKPNIITIKGEVNSPGLYKYNSKQKVNDIIKQAGGLNPNANIDDIHIKYPNGRSSNYKRWYKNPKVTDGSIIIVGTKPEEEPFDRTEYLKEVTSIIANLAQAITVIVLAVRS